VTDALDLLGADGRPVCGSPCVHGGRESTRRRSRADLAWQGHCNRRVAREGDRCWQHPVEARP